MAVAKLMDNVDSGQHNIGETLDQLKHLSVKLLVNTTIKHYAGMIACAILIWVFGVRSVN